MKKFDLGKFVRFVNKISSLRRLAHIRENLLTKQSRGCLGLASLAYLCVEQRIREVRMRNMIC